MRRASLLASSALPMVIAHDERFPKMPDTLLQYMTPGQSHQYTVHREYGNEVHVIDNLVVMINGRDVGGYKLRYSTYAKMTPEQQQWARFSAHAYAVEERRVRAHIRENGIVHHLFAPKPWFPHNPMGAGA